MQKALVILLLIFLASGCSILRRGSKLSSGIPGGNSLNTAQLAKNNITGKDFHLIKAEIKLISDGINEKFLGNIKYKDPDRYLISIRNSAGIEGARAIITADSMKINDRLNKIYYLADRNYIYNKYGITTKLIPLVIGDYITENNYDDTIKCEKNNACINEIIEDLNIRYIVDCNIEKVIKIEIDDYIKGRYLKIECSDFKNFGDNYIAEKIIIENEKNEKIVIDIIKIEAAILNDIELIPGRNYDTIVLK